MNANLPTPKIPMEWSEEKNKLKTIILILPDEDQNGCLEDLFWNSIDESDFIRKRVGRYFSKFSQKQEFKKSIIKHKLSVYLSFLFPYPTISCALDYNHININDENKFKVICSFIKRLIE